MSFQLIDRTCWPREPYFQHYFSAVPCSYSLTARLDITALRRAGLRLYPTLLFALTQVVNRHPEFRTALDPQGRLGIFDRMYPSYTVFSPRTETFTVLWTRRGLCHFLRRLRPGYCRLRRCMPGGWEARRAGQSLFCVHAPLDLF